MQKFKQFDAKPHHSDKQEDHIAIPFVNGRAATTSSSSSFVTTTTTTTTTANRRTLVVPKQSDLVCDDDDDDDDDYRDQKQPASTALVRVSTPQQRLDYYDDQCARNDSYVPPPPAPAALPLVDRKKRPMPVMRIPNKAACVEEDEHYNDEYDDGDGGGANLQRMDYGGGDDAGSVSGGADSADNDSETIHTMDTFTSQVDSQQRPVRRRRRAPFAAPGADAASEANSASQQVNPEVQHLQMARLRAGVNIPIGSPFWSSLVARYGRWCDPEQCLGCCRDIGGHARLIDKEMSELLNQLDGKLNSGIHAAINWSGAYFKKNIYEMFIGSVPDSDKPMWALWCSGINIIGHFYDHANHETLKQKFKCLEYERIVVQAKDTMCFRTMNDPEGAVRIDKHSSNAITKLEMLVLRLKTAKFENSCFYDPAFSRAEVRVSAETRTKRTSTQV
jgi:hypothetical protein